MKEILTPRGPVSCEYSHLTSTQEAHREETATGSYSPQLLAQDNREYSEQNSEKNTAGVTLRVVVLSLLLAVFFGYIIPVIDVKVSNTFLGAAHLPPGAVAVLLILVLVINPLLKVLAHKKSRWQFSRNEVLTVYITCLFSCLTPGHGAENYFISNLVAPFYYATPENNWLSFLRPYLQHWFTPALDAKGNYNEYAAAGWYTALRPEEAIPWGAWLLPLLTWSVLILASYFMLACLGVMLHRQWAEKETLTFPLLRLPLEMTANVDGTSPRTDFFRNGIMWVGFSVAVLIQMMNGLNLYFPDVPTFPLELTGNFFSDVPLNQMGWIPFRIYPIVIGIAFLLTLEVSLSLWFFFLFIKFQNIAAYYMGYMPDTLPYMHNHIMGAKNFVGFQQLGAALAYVGCVMWIARRHLGYIVRRAVPFLGPRVLADEAERNEAMSYPVAFWGFIISFGIMVLWSVAAGARLDLAITFWIVYLVVTIALTRIVVEGGLLFVQQGWTPLAAIAQLTPSGPGTWISTQTAVPMGFIESSLATDMRAFLLPSFIQSFKLAHERKIKMKPLLLLIFAVIIITFVMSLWMNVRLGYEHGGLQLNGWFSRQGPTRPASLSHEITTGVTQWSWLNWGWTMAGAALTLIITIARARFLWFPLHPLGYVMCFTYPMAMLWFSIFMGWFFKSLVMRYGGAKTYQAVIPAFLGLALGDVFMMLFWLCVDGWQGRMYHQLMPG